MWVRIMPYKLFLASLPSWLAALILTFPVLFFSHLFLRYFSRIMLNDIPVLLGLKTGVVEDIILHYVVWNLGSRIGMGVAKFIAVFIGLLLVIIPYLFLLTYVLLAYNVGALHASITER